MRRRRLVLVAALAAILVGCGACTKAPSNAELKRLGEQARDDATTACHERDAKGAHAAAERAQEALATARARLKKATEDTKPEAELAALRELVILLEQCGAGARVSAELADELDDCDRKLQALKLKSYRAARGQALKLVAAGLVLAVNTSSAKSFASLSTPEQKVVRTIEALTKVSRPPGGEPDWPAMRKRLETFSSAPPAEVTFALGVSFVLCGQEDLALAEAEGLASADVPEAELRPLWQAARGVIYQLNGLPRLAQREFEDLEASSAAAQGPYGPRFQAMVRLLLAVAACDRADYGRAEREVLEALRVWPNNPLGPLVTSEVQVGEGQYEKAAATLEDWDRAQGATADPWLAQEVRKRAGEIRDKQGAARPLLHDKKFLREATVHCISEAAKSTEAAAMLREFIDSTGDFGCEMLKHVPGTDGKAEPQSRP